MTAATTTVSRRANIALWTAQSLLCTLFLFAGSAKFAMPADKLVDASSVPLSFIYVIGAAELLGALGLVLPGLVRRHRDLTPLAAIGFVIIMTGATVLTATTGPVATALLPFVAGIFCGVVAYGRRSWAPYLESRQPATLAPTR